MGVQKDRMLRGEWHRILSGLLGEFGPGATVLPRFQCSYGFLTNLGTNTFVNTDAIFMDDAPITIGDNTWLGGTRTPRWKWPSGCGNRLPRKDNRPRTPCRHRRRR